MEVPNAPGTMIHWNVHPPCETAGLYFPPSGRPCQEWSPLRCHRHLFPLASAFRSLL